MIFNGWKMIDGKCKHPYNFHTVTTFNNEGSFLLQIRCLPTQVEESDTESDRIS